MARLLRGGAAMLFTMATSAMAADAAPREKELVDVILTEYYPYRWVNNAVQNIKFQINPTPDPDDPDDDPDKPDDPGNKDPGSRSNESNVEKWILVAFCSICILAMIVCIIVLIVYKVRKSRRQK